MVITREETVKKLEDDLLSIPLGSVKHAHNDIIGLLIHTEK